MWILCQDVTSMTSSLGLYRVLAPIWNLGLVLPYTHDSQLCDPWNFPRVVPGFPRNALQHSRSSLDCSPELIHSPHSILSLSPVTCTHRHLRGCRKSMKHTVRLTTAVIHFSQPIFSLSHFPLCCDKISLSNKGFVWLAIGGNGSPC